MLASLVALLLIPLAAAEALPPAQPHAWYRGEQVQSLVDGRVIGWENAADREGRRGLDRSHGQPCAVRVKTPGGERRVVRLDGDSALWQAADARNTLRGARTVVAYLRLHDRAAGFLFDGSTNLGMCRAQIRDGRWQAGAQPPPIANASRPDAPTLSARGGTWQAHAFLFTPGPDSLSVRHRSPGVTEVQTTVATRAPLAGFVLGANGALKDGLEADVAEVLVYDRALTEAEWKQTAAYLGARWGTPVELPADPTADPLKDPAVFRTVVARHGDDGVHTYRIPGLATSTKGTLLAVFDLRHRNSGDLPGDIDVGLKRSSDGGKTWSKTIRILDYDSKVAGSRGNGVGDPAILVDRRNNTAYVAALWSQGDRGWAGSGPGLTPAETGQFVLTRSSDDGLTWSRPISITPKVKDPKWRLFFQGPGAGIQLRDGTLVFAAQYRDADGTPHSCFVHSRDGDTWQVSAPAIPRRPPTSEAQIAELSDGSLLLTMRDESRSGKRAWASYRWKDDLAGGTWDAPRLDLPDPTCMASLVRHPSGALLFSNAATANRRIALTVRVSRDDGRTWSAGRLLDPRPCAYSCLSVLADGSIGVLYEAGPRSGIEELTFARFSLAWAEGKKAAAAEAK